MSSDPQRIRPILIGELNCLVMTGLQWSWVRRHAGELGVRLVKIGTKSIIVGDELLAALERRRQPEPVSTPSEADELAALRERVRRAG